MTNDVLKSGWGYSFDQERYEGLFATKDEAIKEAGIEAHENAETVAWIGFGSSPDDYEQYLSADMLIESICESDEFDSEWAEDAFICEKEVRDELTAELRKLFRDWVERHNLQPPFYTIDPKTVERHAF